MKPEFELGTVVITNGIADKIEDDRRFAKFLQLSLERYMSCDWGDTCEENKRGNDKALKYDNKLLAAYIWKDDVKIWIITEWDRSTTTILFPDEY